VLLFAATLHAAEFVVKPGSPNQVVFTSKATTETFQGKTDKVQGRIVLDPASVADSVLVHIEVDLASLDTGIGKRNQTMRDDYLETKKYPRAVFDGVTIRSGAGKPLGGDPAFEVEGNFTLHGVTRRLHATVEVLQKDARTLEFKAAFKVPLADYKITRPKFLFLKLGEVQDVAVTGTATLAP
jgi:polyisoprenoid-binding protein YceI